VIAVDFFAGPETAGHDAFGSAVAVCGLDARGLSSARALRGGGSRVLAWDESADARAAAAAEGFEVVDLRERDWGDIAALVASSAFSRADPTHARIFDLAALTRTPVIGDLELFARAVAAKPPGMRGRVVVIAGSRGKSTTAAMIGAVLKASGRDAQVSLGGGAPVLSLAPPHAGAIYVIEVGARDLELAPSLAPKIAVLLNAEDADREGLRGRINPAEVWGRVFAGQGPTDYAVVGVDDAGGREIAMEISARDGGPTPAPVSVGRALGRGVHAVGGVLFDALDGRAQEVLDLRRAPALVGRGSWQNAASAYAVCRLLGLEPAKIAEQILAVPGLPHRLEEVGRIGTVRFFNDSEASEPGSARHGLAAFENVYWIAGGRRAEASFASLSALMPRVAKAYLIGEAAETVAAQLKGRVVAEIARDLKTAVEHAAADAARSKRADPVVLLSPACAAGDQFVDEAARGDAFRALVGALPRPSMSGEAA
jgi:UDP-N-acetylmuramoylalanine--D-glutamate ligase